MKRTAADFLTEARTDDPYELAVPGRKTPLRPKAWSQFTHDEQHQLTMAQFKWGKAIESGEVVGYPEAEQPFFVELRIRFGKDYDAFWKEASGWPKSAVDKLVKEVDEHYDPTPGDKCDECDGTGRKLGDGAGEGRRLTSVGS